MDNGGAFYQEGSVGRQSLGGNSFADGDKPKTDWDAQTITHMTCKQANELFLNSNTGTVQSASGREVVHVAVLGRILGVDQPGTKVKYTITDGTGPLVFASWLNNNNDEGFGDEGSANAKLTSFGECVLFDD